jgi:hypothetical protein
VVVRVPLSSKREALLKRVSMLKRRPDLSEDDFRRGWIVHRDLVRQMPGVAGYKPNVVIARERIKGQPCAYNALSIDGIVGCGLRIQEHWKPPSSRLQGTRR